MNRLEKKENRTLTIEPSLEICLFAKDGKVAIRADGGCLDTVRR